MNEVSLKIGFLLGSPDINGGTYVIYEHAAGLIELGHRVAVITKESVTEERYAWHPRAKNLEWLTLSEASVKEFDLVFATWWQSPFLLPRLQATHYAYFVQSIETRFFEPPDPENHDSQHNDIGKGLCEDTYSIAIPMITEAKWIQKYVYDHFNNFPELARNGIRKDLYTQEGESVAPRLEEGIRVLVEGPVDVFYKNVPKSIELCKKAGVAEVWMLTSSDVDSYPGVDRVFSRIPIEQVATVYRSCDVLLKLSYVEGMFGPPLEMFHCGGTSIVYDVTGHDEYIVHDENSYVVPMDEEHLVVEGLQRLQSDREELRRLKKGALDTAASWPDWKEATDQFHQAVKKICSGLPTSKNYIKEIGSRLKEKNTAEITAHEFKMFAKRESGSTTKKKLVNCFAQLYWKTNDVFDNARMVWQRYVSDEWQTLTFQQEITGFPFWLRLDPSIRQGVIQFKSLEISNSSKNEKLVSFSTPSDFHGCYVSGTATWLDNEDACALLSTGHDPLLILPAVETGEIGDTVELKITLKESGIGDFYRERVQNLKAAAVPPAPPQVGITRRVVRKLKKVTKT